jgi:hypothetical protein
MTYVYERMMDQLVMDRHQSLAELYDASQRRSVVVTGLGSMLIRFGEWLRHDVEVPVMTASNQPRLKPGGC